MLNIDVMVVEDDKELREILSRILSREVRTLHSYSQSSEALHAIKTSRPDLIITDIKMPGMSGLEMIEIIKKLYADIPVIVVSAFSEQEYFIKAIEAKVSHFLTKPVDIPKLITMIERISQEIKIKSELQE
ncbi:response regulator [bacterium]|nr:response regulator [bacterium]MBU1989108.1 response regulator [bacterium]